MNIRFINRLVLLAAFCVLSVASFAQSVEKAFAALNLPYRSFGSTDKPEKFKTSSLSGKAGAARVKLKNEMFNEIEYRYDELGELIEMVVFPKINSYKKNLPDITATLKQYFPNERTLNLGKDNLIFLKDSTFTVEIAARVNQYRQTVGSITFEPIHNIKIKEAYDEFNKTTLLTTVNASGFQFGKDRYECYLLFYAIKETERYFMLIQSKTSQFKYMTSVKIMVDNGDVQELKLTDKKVNPQSLEEFAYENVYTELPKDLVIKMLNGKSVKMRIEGRENGDIELGAHDLEALQLLKSSTGKK